MISIFDLPHILEAIGDNLSGPDIQSCALVCHSWSLIFIPLSWRKFTLESRDYSRLLSQSRSRTLFDKRVFTIRDLSIHGDPCLAPLEKHFLADPALLENQLTRICYLGYGFSINDEGQTVIPTSAVEHTDSITSMNMVFHLIEKNVANLLNLELWLDDWTEDITNKLTSQFLRMKSLKTLVLKGHRQKPFRLRSLCLIMQCYPTTVEYLEIDYASTFNYDGVLWWVGGYSYFNESAFGWNNYEGLSTRVGVAWYWSQVKQSNLQKLILPCYFARIYPERSCPVVLELLRLRCEKLKALRLPIMQADPKALSQALEKCVELRELEFDGIREDMLELYPAAIEACKNLESLIVTGIVHDAREVINAVISTHAKTIKKIKWVGGGGFNGGLDLEIFLRNCQNLKSLETTFGSLYDFTDQGAIGGLRIRDEPLPSVTPTSTTTLDLSLSSLTLEESSSSSTTANLSCPTLPPNSYWPCRETLTYLDVSFYPDRKISNEKQFRSQIEHAYKKIGQLHELVTLHLGCHCRCEGSHLVYCTHSRWDYEQGDAEIVVPPSPPPQPIIQERQAYFPMSVLLAGAQDGVILDMSLSTGLAHLSNLKKLRLLNITKIQGHKMGYPELEWMQENWPQLKEFYGTKNAKIRTWVQEHWPALQFS
ncbi:hypothetical protein BGX27_003075 [Mortierella sp. AM989]|nr:hypothetical protein BGX27_003075 [Mortierella sp. AM989]